MNSGVIFLLAAVAAPAPVISQLNRIPPVEQCSDVPGFEPFRKQLLSAIERQNSTALLALTADEVMATFGPGGQGKREFIDTWALDKPVTSPLWGQLRQAMALGCARSGDALVSPSIIVQIDNGIDAFNTVLAVEPGTPVYSEGSESSTVIALLDWDILTLRDDEIVEPFVPVTMADGRHGYVDYGKVRSILDYRAIFERRDGQWLMTAFIGGD